MAALLAISTIALTGPVGAASGGRHVTDGSTAPVATVDASYALVQLKGEPLSTYAKTKPTQGKKIDFNSSTVKSYKALLAVQRNAFKQWLQTNAPKAKITGSWDISLNGVGVKLNGTTLAKLRTSPQVKRAEFQGLYRPTADDPDLALINAVDAWSSTQVGGAANAGAGVKVAIIDTGIDITHPCFSDAGYPTQIQLGTHAYTNNKVIVAKVFNNKGNQNGFDAKAVQEHGTHVAGTVACNLNTPAMVDGATIPYAPSGVAPRALLGNYNIFPGNVLNARSEDILNALDAAYADGMDVANLSLGGPHSGIQDLMTVAIDDVDIANMVVAVAAGNEGAGDATAHPPLAPGHYTVSSPGSAARALTAGASSVGHTVRSLVKQGTNTYASERGDFSAPTADLTRATATAPAGSPATDVGGLNDGCDAYPSPSTVAGQIVLIARDVCTFAVKVKNAQAAGAAAAIIVNRDATPIPMADDPALGNTIPAAMVGKADGLALVANVSDNATITAPMYVSQDDPATAAFAPEANVQMYFSGQGPTDVDFRVKPDVMAPGGNVLSSIPHQFCAAPPCWAFFDGTSMATPHLAGAAAVVRGAHPSWTAAQVRSAIVDTASRGVVTSFVNGAVVTDVNVIGAGLLNLDAAVAAKVAVGPVSTSFGAVSVGSGQTRTASVAITNLTATSKTFSLAIANTLGAGVSFALGQSSVTLDAGVSTSVTVTMTAAKGAAPGDHQAWLNITDGATPVAHAAVYAFVK
jgi:Subtilase family.